MTKETWGRVCNELLKTVGKSNYTTWIAPLRMIDMAEGIAALARFRAQQKAADAQADAHG